MNKDEIFRAIREGSEEEARKLCEQLAENANRAAVLAILARNFSHGLGRFHPQKNREKSL